MVPRGAEIPGPPSNGAVGDADEILATHHIGTVPQGVPPTEQSESRRSLARMSWLSSPYGTTAIVDVGVDELCRRVRRMTAGGFGERQVCHSLLLTLTTGGRRIRLNRKVPYRPLERAVTMTADERWKDRFAAELERRDISTERIREEIDAVEDFIQESDASAEDMFGDPGQYAAKLAPDSGSGTPSSATVLTLLATMALFTVFTLSALQWINGGDTDTALWAVASGFAFLTTTATLSVLLARSVVASALRDQFTQKSDVQLRAAATLMLLMPWLFVVFAGIVISAVALR